MSIVNFVVGEKGGVGKSQVALALIAYYTMHAIILIICEADRSNGDVGRATEGKDGHTVLRPHFSEDADETDKADEILDTVLEKGVTGVVNCPAQSHRAMVQWISQGSADIALEEGVQLVFWFVTSGEYDSMALFLESLKEFENIPHILVRNTYFTDRLDYDYSDPERNDTVKEALATHNVPVINFPRFTPKKDLDHIKAHSLTFLEALEPKGGLTSTRRSRVKRALHRFFSEIETLQILKSNDTSKPANTDTRKQDTGSNSPKKSTQRKKRSRAKTSVGDNSQDGDI